MNVLTDRETLEFVTSNAWASGLRLDDRSNISYGHQAARSLRLNYPETPLRISYAARLLSMLGCSGDESCFNGALLWLRLWNIGSPQLEMSGWKMIERMRMGYGELRPLGDANAHWFRPDEIADLAAFIVPCFVYGWDAYVLPSGKDSFGFISHDEIWFVNARNPETKDTLIRDFAGFNPI